MPFWDTDLQRSTLVDFHYVAQSSTKSRQLSNRRYTLNMSPRKSNRRYVRKYSRQHQIAKTGQSVKVQEIPASWESWRASSLPSVAGWKTLRADAVQERHHLLQGNQATHKSIDFRCASFEAHRIYWLLGIVRIRLKCGWNHYLQMNIGGRYSKGDPMIDGLFVIRKEYGDLIF